MFAIMSFLTYIRYMDVDDKPLVWLHSEVKSPPFSQEARLEAGFLRGNYRYEHNTKEKTGSQGLAYWLS